MTTMDALRLLIANGRTDGLGVKAARLCALGLISTEDRDTILQEITDKEAGQ